MHLKVEMLVKALGYVVCGSTMLSALTAAAQSKPQTVEAIVIPGSNIKRIDAEGPLPIQVITREEIERSAAATVGDFVRALTVNSGGSSSDSDVNNQSGAAGIFRCVDWVRNPHWS